MKQVLIIAALFAAVSVGVAAQEKSVPLKDAPGRAVTENLCSGCHSLDYIRINAPFMNRQTWTAEVNKMIQAFGAPIQMNDAGTIIDYLAVNYGPPQ
jgi:cytochrome c553